MRNIDFGKSCRPIRFFKSFDSERFVKLVQVFIHEERKYFENFHESE